MFTINKDERIQSEEDDKVEEDLSEDEDEDQSFDNLFTHLNSLNKTKEDKKNIEVLNGHKKENLGGLEEEKEKLKEKIEIGKLENKDKKVTSADFVLNEFARTMVLVDSNIAKAKEIASNMDWSVNKKGYRQRLISQKFEPEHNDEIWILFKLNRYIEIKDIQIGFTNFWTTDTEVYIEPSSVIIEAGMTQDETTSI
jgi:hypothetical protein